MHTRRWTVAAGVALAMLVGIAGAEGPSFKRVELQRHDMVISGREAVGGELTVEVEGQPPKTLKAGDTFFIPAETVHAGKASGTGGAIVLSTYIVEKGKAARHARQVAEVSRRRAHRLCSPGVDDAQPHPTLRGTDSRDRRGPAETPWGVTILHSPAEALVARHVAVGAQLRFGRADEDSVDLAIADPKMSRRHATLARRAGGGGYEILDHGSSNGTFVNGRRVELGAVVAGDIVRMGNTLVLVGPPANELAAAETVAQRVAASSIPVLLLGETGVGKDLLASKIHAFSGRRGELVAVNCATLPNELAEAALFGHKKGAFTGAGADSPGFFGQADGGTLFLDEIGDLPAHQQPKLLRALENQERVPVGSTRSVRADARVVAATHVDLAAACAAGRFRDDLYARLAGAVIRLPPLRARRGEILGLAARFLAEQAGGAARHRFSTPAAELLLLHAWPRNVRELRTTMQRLALLLPEGGVVARAQLQEVLEPEPPARAERAAPPSRSVSKAPDRAELIAAFEAARGNVNRVAEQYRKDPKQIYRWLKRYALDPDRFR